MHIQDAWQRGYTGKGVVVSILDDGIQGNHPDLSQNYVSTDLGSTLFRMKSSENVVSRLVCIHDGVSARKSEFFELGVLLGEGAMARRHI